MDFGDVKKWHVGLVIPIFTGVLVWSYTQMDPTPNPRTTSPMMFEQAVLSKPNGTTKMVFDIHVYPPVDGITTVNFSEYKPSPKSPNQWEPQGWSFTAKTPYVPTMFRPSPGEAQNETIQTWLTRVQKEHPDITYTYEWWREPKRLWTVWGAGSGILVLWGVLIPSILWLVKGGAKEFKDAATAAPRPVLATAVNTGPTAEEQGQLHAMIDSLEESTEGGVLGAGPGKNGAGTAVAVAGTPKLMTGKPLEALNIPSAEDAKKEYEGVFYPVARGPGKKEKGPGE